MPQPKKGDCERCKRHIGSIDMDYCAVCSKDLCDECMAKGCCGNIPAKSGLTEDFGEDDLSDDTE